MAEKYLLSYSAAAIRRADCVTLAKAYLECNDWAEVRHRVLDDDILLIKAKSSRKRIATELIRRMMCLDDGEISALASVSGSKAQAAICWIAVCRSYGFISKFITDCAAERWFGGMKTLTDGVYDSFVSEEAVAHPELVTISSATQGKIRSQLFTMLREMEFVDKAGNMIGYVMPSDCEAIISSDDLRWFPTMG